MPIGAGLGMAIAGGLGLVGAGMSANAANNAANLQANAAANAQALQQQNFNTINSQQAPVRQLGYNAINRIGSLGSGTYGIVDQNGNPAGTGVGSGYLTNQFGAADLNSQIAPNYGFVLQQGQNALQASNNVGGGLIGGNALAGLQNYTQGLAGNQYQNAFTNYQNQRNNIYGMLASQAGLGQVGQNQVNTAGTTTATNQGALGIGGASALGQGQMGVANAYGGALNNLGNNAMLYSLLNQNPSITPTDMTGFQTPYVAPTYSPSANSLNSLGSGTFNVNSGGALGSGTFNPGGY
jgi:hypothetical protein